MLAGAHHERIDGSGYPNARRLTDLTLEMRILAVADVFEAMTAHRPYRDAMTTDEALDLIGRDAGIRLCAVSVAALEVWAGQDDGPNRRDRVACPHAGSGAPVRRPARARRLVAT